MDTDEHRLALLNKVTETVLACAFKVSNGLGSGFLEKVYENALAYELCKAGLKVEQQKPVPVRYKDVVVGDYMADLIVEGSVIVELKAVKALDDVHSAQCINYLRATNLPICLLINFGNPRLEYKRLMGPAAQR